MRWWQNTNTRESFKAEISVGSFEENFNNDGAEVAYPKVIAAMSRIVKYYYQAISDQPYDEDGVTVWGDEVMSAYIESILPPAEK